MTSSHPWISDRPPTREDADVNSYVEVRRTPNGKQGIHLHWQMVPEGQQWRFTRHWQDSLIAKKPPSSQAIQKCIDCRYWSGQGKDSEGFCRRCAPHPHAPIPCDSELVTLWPTTWDTDWCGEWEAKP